jgi:hypothetical protein
MRWLVEDATLICDHGGRVAIDPVQALVRIEKRRVLVARDPESRSISACPNANPVIGLRPCLKTLVAHGYSSFVKIQGRKVCLDSIRGLTDGSPPGTVNYKVVDPAQAFVSAEA